MFSYGPASTGCFLGYGEKYQGDVRGLDYNKSRHIVKYIPEEGIYFDGNLVTTASVNLTTWEGTSKGLYLGTCHRNDQGINPDLHAPIRIYSCKIWEKGVLQRDFVPCKRKYDGRIGLCDNVAKKFYYGQGADFTAPLPPKGLVIIIL